MHKDDEVMLTTRREAVRNTLDRYERALKLVLDGVPRGSGNADNEFDNIKASITQVQSAKRVLYLDN